MDDNTMDAAIKLALAVKADLEYALLDVGDAVYS